MLVIQVEKQTVEMILYTLLYSASTHIRFPAIRTSISEETKRLMGDSINFKAWFWNEWIRGNFPEEWRNRYNPGGMFCE